MLELFNHMFCNMYSTWKVKSFDLSGVAAKCFGIKVVATLERILSTGLFKVRKTCIILQICFKQVVVFDRSGARNIVNFFICVF